MKTEGVKHDNGKPPLGLLDGYALEQVALVMANGEKKYGRHNWRGGFKYSRLYDAALRHIFAFIDGTDHDPESNLSPIAHSICMLMFLLRMQKDRPDLDDRYLTGYEIVLRDRGINFNCKEDRTAGFKSAIESADGPGPPASKDEKEARDLFLRSWISGQGQALEATTVREDGEPTKEEVERLMDEIRRAES